jgi:hypothetical protein
MTDIIPYFAGLVTVLFGVGFFLSVREGISKKDE